MVKRSIFLTVLIFAAALCITCQASEVKRKIAVKESDWYLDLKVLSKTESVSADPSKTTYSFELEVTNKTTRPVTFTNVAFYVFDGMGKRYGVSSMRFSQRYIIKPGDKLKVERIYFLIPKNAALKELTIFKAGGLLAKTSL
jgi:hypothetical protein